MNLLHKDILTYVFADNYSSNVGFVLKRIEGIIRKWIDFFVCNIDFSSFLKNARNSMTKKYLDK